VLISRLYADDSGESHFDMVEMPMALKEFAPPAAPLFVSEAWSSSRFVLIELPIAWGGAEPHPTPGRYMMLCLTGSLQFTSSDGASRSISAGEALLMTDTRGKGHATTVTSDKPVKAAMIYLA
jgi:hypothetical protein